MLTVAIKKKVSRVVAFGVFENLFISALPAS